MAVAIVGLSSSCHALLMHFLRSSWLPTILGAGICFIVLVVAESASSRSVATPFLIGGLALCLDGSFGARILPRCLSLARSAEEETLPERMFYSFSLTRTRYGLILAYIVITLGASAVFHEADWLIWGVFLFPLGYLVLLVWHIRRAIDMAGATLEERER